MEAVQGKRETQSPNERHLGSLNQAMSKPKGDSRVFDYISQ